MNAYREAKNITIKGSSIILPARTFTELAIYLFFYNTLFWDWIPKRTSTFCILLLHREV